MIDFKVLPEALLFIAGAVPNTLFMAFVSIFFGILFGSFIAVLRLGNNMFINIFFAVFVSFFAPCQASSSFSSYTTPSPTSCARIQCFFGNGSKAF